MILLGFFDGAYPYGMVRDGNYHELMIPLSGFCNSGLAAVSQFFMVAGDGPATMAFDGVYLTSN
jgi:hypothetical protein